VHPFLPTLSMIFLLAADAAILYLRLNAGDPEVSFHASSIETVVFISLLIGGGLAYWLRRFNLLFPTWFAVVSLLWVAILLMF
jgi:hypothetical protein